MAAAGKTGEELYAELDALQAAAKYDEVLEACAAALAANGDEAEILWRAARGKFDKSDNTADAAAQAALLREGLVHAEHLLELDAKSWLGHKWVAILLSGLGAHLPTKEKIADAFKIKEHAQQALDLHPDGGDATTNHLLGRWCVGVASIGWMERKVASALFGTPPESSYDEALTYFLKCDELDGSLRNTLCMGDAYAALKKWDDAKTQYQRCIDWPDVNTPHAKALVEEATTKIKKC